MKASKLMHVMLITAVVFLVGFILGAKSPEPKWIGYLVFGETAPKPIDSGILMPPPDPFKSSIDSGIIIGLREDGIVVWKQRGSKEQKPGN